MSSLDNRNTRWMIQVLCFFALCLGCTTAHAKVPKGWYVTGRSMTSYTVGLDKTIKHTGKMSATLRSKSTARGGFITLAQAIRADRYRGKRVRLTGWIKTKSVRAWVGMWMRIDGKQQGKKRKVLAFDNMQKRPLRGTLAWRSYSVVLDVPQSSTFAVFGVLLSGQGQVWFDDVRLEVVSRKVPVTGTPFKTVPLAPQNLGFED